MFVRSPQMTSRSVPSGQPRSAETRQAWKRSERGMDSPRKPKLVSWTKQNTPTLRTGPETQKFVCTLQ